MMRVDKGLLTTLDDVVFALFYLNKMRKTMVITSKGLGLFEAPAKRR